MPETFVGEKIEVDYDKENLRPYSFIWRDKKYNVLEVMESWQDWGFSRVGPKRKTWRTRRHRNYYVVKTEEGEFEIYLDRALGRKEWILLERR